MDIKADTRLRDLLEAYPYLVEFLSEYRSEYAKLRNPVLRRTVGRVATLENVAEMGDVDPEALVADIAAEVARHDAGAPADERARRREVLAGIIRDLHAGRPVPELQARFSALAAEVDAAQIAELEQSLIDGGVPAEEVKRLCDLHVEVFKEALEPSEPPSRPLGHPVDTIRRENVEAGRVTSALREASERVRSEGPEAAHIVAAALEDLGEIDKHYLRKEHQLFPFLEGKGVSGPSSVMWAIHDDVRALLKELSKAAADGDTATLASRVPELADMVDDMVYKEERILLPLAAELLSDDEWEQVRRGEPAIGYAWIVEPPEWPPTPRPRPATLASAVPVGEADLVPLGTGMLSPAQMEMMARILPIDISFVDEDDRVRFFSEGDRVFTRTPAVIGRRVQDCHPPSSLDKVQAILDAFRAGERDVAEFWIELKGRFIHIRYFAMRDDEGRYRGILETVQDVTAIRGLQGERRLVDW